MHSVPFVRESKARVPNVTTGVAYFFAAATGVAAAACVADAATLGCVTTVTGPAALLDATADALGLVVG
jgi:hypothetical protein